MLSIRRHLQRSFPSIVAADERVLTTLPPAIITMIAKEASQFVVCLNNGAVLPIEEVRRHLETLASSAASASASQPELQLCYEVVRVKHRNLMFFADHNRRLLQSLAITLAQPPAKCVTFATDDSECDDSKPGSNIDDEFSAMTNTMNIIKTLNTALIEPDVVYDRLPIQQNVKIVVWGEGIAAASSAHSGDSNGTWSEGSARARINEMLRAGQLRSVAYYIPSTYPPEEWYSPITTPTLVGARGGPGGCDMALLHHAARENPNAKVVQASVRQRAADLQATRNVFEVLLVHGDGVVPEGSRSNFFLITRDGEVLMASDAAVLVGVTRLAVNRVCEARGIPVIKRDVTVANILAADAVVMTGTSVGVLPVRRIFLCREECRNAEVRAMMTSADSDEVIFYESAAHPIVLELQQAYNEEAYGKS